MGLEFYEQEAGQGLFSTSLLVDVVGFFFGTAGM